MTHERAITLFTAMSRHQQEAVLHVFYSIIGAFQDVRDAFAQAVSDEAITIEAEMMLLEQTKGLAH